MTDELNRRGAAPAAEGAAAGASRPGCLPAGTGADVIVDERGAVVAARAETAAQAGHALLEQAGNAVDAAVAAALTAAVVEPASCGIGGYGAHITIALADGTVTCIDANSTAPQAARPDMFPADAAGQVPEKSNYYGWLAAGVPGTLAGLQLALDRYGSKRLGDVAAPAIRHARDGILVDQRVADSFEQAAQHLDQDAGSKQIYAPHDRPLRVGDLYRNAQLAALLEQLAEADSVASFYQGEIAARISAASLRNGGIMVAEDLARYEAREVPPLVIPWGDYSIHTAPLTAGGISTLQAMLILKEAGWPTDHDSPRGQHAVLESLRLAWRDRFHHFGDPEFVDVPLDRLFSQPYVEQLGQLVRDSVDAQRPIPLELTAYDQNGTIHISTGDSAGNLVAMTLTHGGGFGARVTVEGLGLTLGHGISRFDPRPGYANSIAAGKRPLNNMTPTIVLEKGRPRLAIGGRGGRRIPNALLAALLQFTSGPASVRAAIDEPRMHTEGTRQLALDGDWSDHSTRYLAQLGYEITHAKIAYLSAVAFQPSTERIEGASG